jgi:hemerythrin-like domain-containing protein
MNLLNAPRYDLYAPIHKALRAFMSDTLTTLGRVDADDADDLQPALAQLHGLLTMLRSHLQHENEFVHPALEAAHVGASAHIAHEHVEHGVAIDQLEAAASALAAMPASHRAESALALYRQLAMFVAENFEHMHVEETEHNAVLRAAYRDSELIGIEQRIVASQTPEEMRICLRWMLPYMNHAERSAMLCGMRQQVPDFVFDGVLQLAREHLRQRDWIKLAGALTEAPAMAA